MKTNEIAHVRYVKESGDVSERYIIPTFIPQQNIKAIDVTDLSPERREVVIKWLEQYTQYYKQAVSQVFSFEDWVAHTQDEENLQAKWRTFKMNNLETIE